MDALLKCENLVKIFTQGEKTIYAVKDCGMTVRKGEFAAITGPSGSGKSTLLNLMAYLDTPTSGNVFINGKNLSELKDDELSEFRNAEIGFIFQDFNLLPILSAKENILMPSLLSKNPVSRSYFNEIIELLGIGDRLEHLPSELSGGQRQRVAIARALINKPSVIFADEPTGNLDRENSAEIISLMMSLHSQGCTIIMVTHDMDIASKADTVYRMTDGVILKL